MKAPNGLELLRVDMAQLSAEREPLAEQHRQWAGRGLTASILCKEVPPTCDPLGPHNKLIFAPGLLAGRGISSAGRISIGAKSPLTGGIKESNAGGNAAANMIRLGLCGLVIEGAPPADGLFLLELEPQGATFHPAEEYRGLDNYRLADALRDRFGARSTLILLGPAGEARLAAAGIALTDREGTPGRLAARGGLGAVMGSKGIKAIILPEAKHQVDPAVAEPGKLKQALKRYITALQEDYYTSKLFPEVGTPYMVAPMQKLGGLPTRNFSSGAFEDLSEIEGEAVRATILERGGEGKTTHACMAGCVVRCSNVIPDPEGKATVAPIEYESMVMLGPNLGIGSLDAIAEFNQRCNALGVDTVDVGGAIGVAMEAGLLPFSDVEGVFELLDQVEQGTVLGRVIGNGAAIAGHVLGVGRTPVVKGQCIAAYDPRAIKGMGVTYATSPMGADHTAGHTADFPVDHHSPEGQAELSRRSQITAAAWDTLGLCSFVTGAVAPQIAIIVDMLRAIDGEPYPEDHLTDLGREVIQMERGFNQAAGFGPGDDRLPEYFRTEALPPMDLVFDVSDQALDEVFEDLSDA